MYSKDIRFHPHLSKEIHNSASEEWRSSLSSGAIYVKERVLWLSTLSVGIEGHFYLELGLAVLGDRQQSLAVVERFKRIEDNIFLNFAPLDLPLSPSGLPLSFFDLLLFLEHFRWQWEQGFLSNSNFLDKAVLSFFDLHFDLFILGHLFASFSFDNRLDL